MGRSAFPPCSGWAAAAQRDLISAHQTHAPHVRAGGRNAVSPRPDVELRTQQSWHPQSDMREDGIAPT
jgi:hypothetical protein